MVQVGTKIQKMTANNIIGAINDFNDRVIKSAYNMATYHKGNVPKFSGSVNYGSNNKGTVGFTNPAAIPNNQLGEKSIPSLSINDTKIIASTLWNALMNVTKSLSQIRKFESKWYHREQLNVGSNANIVDPVGGLLVLKQTITGHGVFKTSLPDVPYGENKLNGKSEHWYRTGLTSVELNPTNSNMIKDKIASANSYNTALINCYNEWYNKCYNDDANKLTYEYYTCHLNCHGNCHSSRSRR